MDALFGSKVTRFALVCLLVPVMLTGCSKPASDSYTEPATETAAQDMAQTSAEKTTHIPDAPQLAYDYSYTLSANEDHIKGLMQTHENACLMAGTTRCQIMSSAMTSDQSRANAGEHTLTLRAAPEWLRLFRDGLAAQLQSFGGKVVSQSIEGEDLSPAIVDVDAHIANKIALRDRLKAVVQTHKGKISELIDAENQLSGVQGQIDAARAQQTLMQKRVKMAKLTLTYRLDSLTTSRGTFAPLAQALDNVVPTYVGALSLLIKAIAMLLPLGVIIGPVIWLILRRKPPVKPQPEMAER